jgi:hypothetical protein
MRVLCGKPSVVHAGVLALSLVPATVCLAQQPNTPPATTRYQVTVVRIKPDMLDEWIDLQKNEVIPAQKKGGVKERTVLQTAIGNSFEYTILTPYPSFAALDGPAVNVKALGAEAAARLGAKVRKCVDVQRTYLINRVDDLAIPQGNAIASRTQVLRPAPGKTQDYLSYLRADVLPAMKKAKADGKIAGYAVSTRGVGAQAGEMTTTTYYNKFADLDAGNPVALALGAAAAAPIGAKGAALATNVQVIIRRRVADLSF